MLLPTARLSDDAAMRRPLVGLGRSSAKRAAQVDPQLHLLSVLCRRVDNDEWAVVLVHEVADVYDAVAAGACRPL